LATDTQFKGKVKEDMLICMLDAFVKKHDPEYPKRDPQQTPSTRSADPRSQSARPADKEKLSFAYVQGEVKIHPVPTAGANHVQGMNVLAAPFLYTMPSQLEAFECFANFIEKKCPLYVQRTLVGVHDGLEVRLRAARLVVARRQFAFADHAAAGPMPRILRQRIV
jgi:cell cycle arrest protein BUB2